MFGKRKRARTDITKFSWVAAGVLPISLFLAFLSFIEPALTDDDEGLRPSALGSLDDPSASFDRAVRYYRGIGVAQDFKEALTWYLRAAREGFPVEKYRMSEWAVRESGMALASPPRATEARDRAEAEAELLQVVDPLAQLDRAAMRRLQNILTRAGFDPGPADGLLGPKTRAAFERFQERERASQDALAADNEHAGL